MCKIKGFIVLVILILPLSATVAAPITPDNTELAVWANEAIVATYSYDYKNYLARQKEIANYFTSAGWTVYSEALRASNLPENVQKNAYFVSAVATWPPEIKALDNTHWQAVMPLLVVYKNPQYQQKQTLQVTIQFGQVPSGQGVRGLAITSLQAKVSDPICECKPLTDQETTAGAAQ